MDYINMENLSLPRYIVTKCILLAVKVSNMMSHYRRVTQLTSDICEVLMVTLTMSSQQPL